MTTLTLVIVPVLLAVTTSISCLEHYNHEAHTIMKRMAEMDRSFEGHDVARVHFVEGRGQRKRRLAKRDLRRIVGNAGNDVGKRDLHLELSSGSSVNLTVRSAGIVSSDTAVSYRSGNESEVRKRGVEDCYSHGQVTDSSGEGLAAISHCDGLFGFAGTHGYEYFFHPVGAGRSKRDTTEDYDVHVMWRRSGQQSIHNSTDSNEYGADFINPLVSKTTRRLRRSETDRENATGIVLELAMFSDAQYWQQLQKIYPGREDDFLLTRLAGAQALYSDVSKTGVSVQMKLKFLEYWITNPEEYTFKEEFANNLRSFCRYTTKKYVYDAHMLNTGIATWNNGLVGLAYVGEACTINRCLVTKGTGLETFKLYAHELGHLLGMTHYSSCPNDLKSVGGFMGGGNQYNFSPCMKHQLGEFLKKTKSKCLYEESIEPSTPIEFNHLGNAFPGQLKSPDGLCLLLAGNGYKYVPNENRYSLSICSRFACLNEDDNSSEFGRVQRFKTPIGFPCDDESFCKDDNSCHFWNETLMSLKVESLRELTVIPEWSQWSHEVYHCSRSCGTGVRTRRRECQYEGFTLSPYCPGLSVDIELCNIEPCPEEPTGKLELRKLRGQEVCSRLLRDVVEMRETFSTPSNLTTTEIGQITSTIYSQTCTMKCKYVESQYKIDMEAFLPDGTVCNVSKRSNHDLKRFDIDLKCAKGMCLEFTDCPEKSQLKDKCGICGGDGTSCEESFFGSS